MKKAYIRQACPSDIPHLSRICLLTGNAGTDASSLYADSTLLGSYYSVPYYFYDRSYCLMLVPEETEIPAGYIVGTADTQEFTIWRNREWLPCLKKECESGLHGITDQDANLRNMILSQAGNIRQETDDLPDGYPAHFHIDILPELQHCGYGHELVMSFLKLLKAGNVPGVHLGVDGANTGAVSFYKREGFSTLEEKPWGFVMGRQIV
jgi:ribosomal protein S18 acetylase RimI-like enzyme